MFTYPKELISYLDSFRVEHSGTIAIITASVSLVAIVKSTLTTWSLHQQANLQRQIESNRYNLNLFSKRYEFFNSFKEKVHSKGIENTVDNNESFHSKIPLLEDNIKEIRNTILVFGNDDNSEIVLLLKNTKLIKELIERIFNKDQRIEFVRKRIKDTERNIYMASRGDDSINLEEEKLNIEKDGILYNNLHTERRSLKDQYEIVSANYGVLYRSCIEYMERKLSVSGEPYTSKQGWFGFLWSSVVQSAPKHEKYVMWASLTICLIFLGVLLCS